MAKLPLEGIRIVDITVVWVGPFTTQMLADWGAEVIRVEPLQVFQPETRAPNPRALKTGKGGGYGGYPDYDPGKRPWNRNTLFQIHGRNKLSMTADLQSADCMEAFLRLVNVSDVMIENNVPDTMDKLGVSYELLKKVRPDIIMVRVPAYGLSGPYARYRAFGSHMEAVAGHTAIRGYRDLPTPSRGITYFCDAVGGMAAAYATVAALCHRRRTGQGQLVEVATAEATIPYIGEAVMDYTMSQRLQGPLGNRHPSMAPQGCYPCKGEDSWLVISVGSDQEWESLREAMGDPEWARDGCFSTVLGRFNNQDVLDQHIADWTREHDHIELMHHLQKRGIAAAAVHDQKELFNDPHMQHRSFFEELYQPETGTHRYCGMQWKMDQTPNSIRLPSPMLGEHNEWAYKELLGITDQEYRKLEDAGHI
ncbi:MAG: CaiB/BaiF CoA transferase family protein, partial [Dehalococcoidia bacterium]